MWSRSASARCSISRVAARAGGWALAALLASSAIALPLAQAQPAPPGDLGFIEALYRSREAFRAETEALRWLHDHPRDPAQPAVELLRAKLYYRERRFAESDLMLYSLLDRFPQGETAADARRLLGFSQVRQGRIDAGEQLLATANPSVPALAPLRATAQAALDKERALTWSTWLPGTGFFVLDEPGKAAAAISLNVLATAAAVISYRQGNTPAAVLFALVEIALYRGGREAVQEEADTLARRDMTKRTDAWLRDAGEPDLLRIGLRVRF